MSFSETIFLFFLALIIFGPKKLPEIARQVGKYMNEFRRASNEFKAQIEQEIAHLETETRQTILPPEPSVIGATSRSQTAALAESNPVETPVATEATPTLAASAEEPPAPVNGDASSMPATEAVVPSDAHLTEGPPSQAPSSDDVTSTSQESHA